MKKLLVALALVLTLTLPAHAIQDVFSVLGTPGGTVRVAASDASQNITDAIPGTSSTAKGALITVETNDVRFSFRNTAVQTGGSEVGHVVAAGQSLWVMSSQAYNQLKFINKTNGSNGILQITYFY